MEVLTDREQGARPSAYLDTRRQAAIQPLQLSIVVPVYNEERSVELLYDEVASARDATAAGAYSWCT